MKGKSPNIEHNTTITQHHTSSSRVCAAHIYHPLGSTRTHHDPPPTPSPLYPHHARSRSSSQNGQNKVTSPAQPIHNKGVKMPSRSGKKRPQQNQKQKQKRVEVTDANGWTHVTTNGNARRTIRNTSAACSSPSTSTPHTLSESETSLSAAEAPRNLSLDGLRHQFEGYRARWEASESWRVIRDVLERRLTVESGAESGAGAGRIDNMICVGLGSPSGFLKGGWVDRRSVSMYQLAALVCIRDLFGRFIASFFFPHQVYKRQVH